MLFCFIYAKYIFGGVWNAYLQRFCYLMVKRRCKLPIKYLLTHLVYDFFNPSFPFSFCYFLFRKGMRCFSGLSVAPSYASSWQLIVIGSQWMSTRSCSCLMGNVLKQNKPQIKYNHFVSFGVFVKSSPSFNFLEMFSP